RIFPIRRLSFTTKVPFVPQLPDIYPARVSILLYEVVGLGGCSQQLLHTVAVASEHCVIMSAVGGRGQDVFCVQPLCRNARFRPELNGAGGQQCCPAGGPLSGGGKRQRHV